jgi:hypothetical protein
MADLIGAVLGIVFVAMLFIPIPLAIFMVFKNM